MEVYQTQNTYVSIQIPRRGVWEEIYAAPSEDAAKSKINFLAWKYGEVRIVKITITTIREIVGIVKRKE